MHLHGHAYNFNGSKLKAIQYIQHFYLILFLLEKRHIIVYIDIVSTYLGKRPLYIQFLRSLILFHYKIPYCYNWVPGVFGDSNYIIYFD